MIILVPIFFFFLEIAAWFLDNMHFPWLSEEQSYEKYSYRNNLFVGYERSFIDSGLS